MADTFSPNFNFVLPEIGGSADTWGVKLNDNFSDLDTFLRRAMPVGGIIMWSGTVANIPAGWVLCNGSNGTPDLRGRFIVGAGGAYSFGNTGGTDSVTLTTAQLPAHNHTTNAAGTHNHTGATGTVGDHSHTTGTSGSHSHSGSTSSAGAHSHTFRAESINTGDPLGSGGQNLNGNANDEARYNTKNTDSAGAHTHTLSINSAGDHTHVVNAAGSHNHAIDSDGSHTHTVNNTGGGGSHENRPPYYALAYIMRTA